MGISKSIFYTVISQFLVQFLGIVSGIFIARMLGPGGKGVLAIFQANAQLFVSVFSLSMGNVVVYFIPSGKIKVEKILGMSMSVLAFAVIGIGITLFFIDSFSQLEKIFYPDSYNLFLYKIWIYLFSVFSIVNAISTGFLQGYKKFNLINKIWIVNSSLNSSIFFILFLLNYKGYFHVNVQIILYVLLLVTFINTILFVYPFFTQLKIKPSFHISKKEIAQVWKYLLFTHLGIVVAILNIRLGLWVLNYYLDAKTIGLYSVAANLIVMFNMIPTAFGNVLMPYLSDFRNNRVNEMFYKYARLNFSILLVSGVLGYFLAVVLIPILYGTSFTGSIILFRGLLLGVLFIGTNRLLAVYISSRNRQDYNFYASFLGLIFNVSVSFILVRYWGVYGVIFSTVFTYLFIWGIMSYFVHVRLKLPWENYFIVNKQDIEDVIEKYKRRKF